MQRSILQFTGQQPPEVGVVDGWLQVDQPCRRYHYADGTVHEFWAVTHLRYLPAGREVLRTQDGRECCVAPGWRFVEVDPCRPDVAA